MWYNKYVIKLRKEVMKMKIDSNRLRQELNKIYCEMGWVSKNDVIKAIEEIEREEKYK